MQEQLITFETAKLAQEKGCNIWTDLRYTDFNGIIKLEINVSEPFPSAPTQSLLQRWLREIHNIEVNANVNFYNRKVKLGYYYTIDKFDENNIHDGKNYDDDQISIIGNEEGNNTFEEALEVGLQEALKLIEICKKV